MSTPDMASKRWVTQQYDQHVMNDTVRGPGGDAGVVRIYGTNRALAVTSDCTPRYCSAHPYEGGKQVVAEAWRNLTAVGATPIAVTDNLNFGNPERPEIMGQIVGCIEGMAEACRALDFPVVSGNVSLYNETNGVAIPPTPVIGAVGVIDDLARRAHIGGAQSGDVLVLVGETTGWLGASMYLRAVLGREEGAPPPVDLAAEKRNGDFVRGLIRSGLVTAAHDLSDGGLAAAAVDMAMAAGLGFRIASSDLPAHEWLYGEDQGRYLLAASSDVAHQILVKGAEAGVHAAIIGEIGGDWLIAANGFEISLEDLQKAHEGWLPEFMS